MAFFLDLAEPVAQAVVLTKLAEREAHAVKLPLGLPFSYCVVVSRVRSWGSGVSLAYFLVVAEWLSGEGGAHWEGGRAHALTPELLAVRI